MTADEVQAAASALTTAVQTNAEQAAVTNVAAEQQLAPGLNTGSNSPGGYNYNRIIAPTIAPAQTALQVQAKQAVLKQALKDAQFVSKTNYDNANYAMQQRQRDYQKKEAEEAKRRYAASVRAASSGGGGGGSAGSSIGGIQEVSNSGGAKQYIGNNDTRGKLAWIAKNSPDATTRNDAAIALKYVGNDGKFGNAPAWTAAAMNRFGFTGNYAKAAAPAPAQKVVPQAIPLLNIPRR